MSASKWKDEGNEEFRKGNYAKAIECYTYATEMDPKNPVYFTNRSMCYFKMGEYQKSLRDALKSISLDSNWVKGYYRAGMAEIQLGMLKEAVKHLSEAAAMDPSMPAYQEAADDAKRKFYATLSPAEIIKTEGNELYKSGQIEKAIEKYTQALEKVDLSDEKGRQIAADIYSNRAMCYQQRWASDKVVEDATKAIELNPNHAKAYCRRAQAYENLEKYKKALEDYETALRIEPALDVAIAGAVRVRGTLRKMGL